MSPGRNRGQLIYTLRQRELREAFKKQNRIKNYNEWVKTSQTAKDIIKSWSRGGASYNDFITAGTSRANNDDRADDKEPESVNDAEPVEPEQPEQSDSNFSPYMSPGRNRGQLIYTLRQRKLHEAFKKQNRIKNYNEWVKTSQTAKDIIKSWSRGGASYNDFITAGTSRVNNDDRADDDEPESVNDAETVEPKQPEQSDSNFSPYMSPGRNRGQLIYTFRQRGLREAFKKQNRIKNYNEWVKTSQTAKDIIKSWSRGGASYNDFITAGTSRANNDDRADDDEPKSVNDAEPVEPEQSDSNF
ncbi:uncharacterized protein LOC123301459 isoform X1 [Chrysoperla carnea]|uniref:uncharacterized protein LOC123301459 isoform X1 n=1 Tax=Chrysoperla carnea TaxID=189513 RepID=UPI001D08F232|nr:uncharacterized protein LOC123301459 isoform X1 [Chrysoperla carnea]XP_044740136.1 uncharacterized protein LOC123301459 isoform X1 [Chrysoperla carnea]XP_044740137.1 uncharacterized protein LOC123301459 isoform X1 [Chrysoperla carnea]